MSGASPASTVSGGLLHHKRAHSPDTASSDAAHSTGYGLSPTAVTGGGAGIVAASSVFRNVSACNRCRSRKNRCDQNLPACASCEKAKVNCVGYDPITKKEIPRSYVYYLETRVAYLEKVLDEHGIPYTPADNLDMSSKPNPASTSKSPQASIADTMEGVIPTKSSTAIAHGSHKRTDSEKLDHLVTNIGMVSVQGTSDSRFLGSTSGISFARMVLTAIKQSVSSNNSERAGTRPSRLPGSTHPTSMRDSFFGLHKKASIREAPFPDRDVGFRLVEQYFEHANPQIPILHRDEFMLIVKKVYSVEPHERTPRELYMLNIVFAIGAGVFLNKPETTESDPASGSRREQFSPTTKRARLSGYQAQPEEYHAAAVVHLEQFFGSSQSSERDQFIGSLEELQGVLLLAGFALLRPVPPGLWYIVGIALRLAMDLGLHYEDGAGIEATSQDQAALGVKQGSFVGDDRGEGTEKGRREWLRDYRRRLWWCTYSFDRLVSTCVGRPFGINDDVITTEFPSLLSDDNISAAGFSLDQDVMFKATPKLIAHHYFRLRLLQSEILQVLQHESARQIRITGGNGQNIYIHNRLPSPFLYKYTGFRAWRADIDQRLKNWFESSPRSKDETGVDFNLEFLELNYWQALIMLYRQSIKVPAVLAGDASRPEDPALSRPMDDKDEEERVFLRVAEAGQKILKLYRQLHRMHLVSYTFLATHHLFMAGISFLYAIWHSPAVRTNLTMDDVDNTILAATSVLTDLIEKCPPAEACRDAFERMGRATVGMFAASLGKPDVNAMRRHRFDMDLTDLFPPPAPKQQTRNLQQTSPTMAYSDATGQYQSGNYSNVPLSSSSATGLGSQQQQQGGGISNSRYTRQQAPSFQNFDFDFDLGSLTQWPMQPFGMSTSANAMPITVSASSSAGINRNNTSNVLGASSQQQQRDSSSGSGMGVDEESGSGDNEMNSGFDIMGLQGSTGLTPLEWDPALFNPLGGYFFGNSDDS